ncbi:MULTISPECIES: spore germination protein GerPE [Bacillaceae]|uniref:spore germination protein GerPE n=1 Tax=Bacillaceae TaxID=186817 RepID=UPI0006713BB8|nr:spore germination protein GerPE [Bacillus sp. FJAT-27916]
MWERTSIVNNIHVSILSRGAIFEVGEIQYFRTSDNVLAYQREQELFFGQEGNFGDYKVFYAEPDFEPVYEPIQMSFLNPNPYIYVGGIQSQAVSSSSILQIGNGRYMRHETRVMNIRQLLSNRQTKEGGD